jgi:uncharacterized hydrophobic protein (TIGR00271 family)
MRDQLFFDGEHAADKLSRYWLLLPLAAVIASAGVAGDSTATVIGAMIVAPLMTPILGTALAATLIDRANLLRSIGLVVTGAVSVVAVGYLVGMLVELPIVAATNSQVAARVQPRLIDLLAALATGAVGAIALSRADISDTLPGVAIAISLVPPLAVVGLTLEAGEASQALGALLLFVTNVSAILATGVISLVVRGVHRHAVVDDRGRRSSLARSGVVIGLMVVLVAVPLAATSRQVTTNTIRENAIRRVTSQWASDNGWSVATITSRDTGTYVRVTGPLPEPDADELRERLEAEGLPTDDIDVELIPGRVVVIAPKR